MATAGSIRSTNSRRAVISSAPTEADRSRWEEADRAARPRRLARLRERLAAEGIDAYYGVTHENVRYLTGFALRDGEDGGSSGQFIVGTEDVLLFADSRYTIQAARQAPDARIETVYGDLPEGGAGDYLVWYEATRYAKVPPILENPQFRSSEFPS